MEGNKSDNLEEVKFHINHSENNGTPLILTGGVLPAIQEEVDKLPGFSNNWE